MTSLPALRGRQTDSVEDHTGSGDRAGAECLPQLEPFIEHLGAWGGREVKDRGSELREGPG